MIVPCASAALTWTLPTTVAIFITLPNFATSTGKGEDTEFMKSLLDSALKSIPQRRQRVTNLTRSKPSTKRRYSMPSRRQRIHNNRRRPKGKIYQRKEYDNGWYPPYVPMTMMPPPTHPPHPTEPPTKPPPPPPPSSRKSNKALLAVVAPLALLASLGPLLAAQVMIPWATSSAISGRIDGSSSRIKRWLTTQPEWTPLTAAGRSSEAERAVQKLQMIRDYLYEVDQQRSHRDDIMVSYLECRGFTDPEDHCLERLSCEFADPNNSVITIEREVMAMVIYNIITNDRVDEGLKVRMKRAAAFGYKNSGHCVIYWCYKVDKDNSPAIDVS